MNPLEELLKQVKDDEFDEEELKRLRLEVGRLARLIKQRLREFHSK